VIKGVGEAHVTTAQSGPGIDNPWRQQLVTLKSDLQKEMRELQGLLRKPCSDVGGKISWTGPAADTWYGEADGRRKDMLAQLTKLLPLVDAEIAKCPEKVPPGQAKSMRADLARQ
jgi:hypothetical protein